MSDLGKQRQAFAEVLETNLIVYRQGDFSNWTFLQEFYKPDYPFAHPEEQSDKSVNSAWHLADEFFDAAWEGFPEVTYGFSIQYCETLLQHVIENFKNGLPVTHPDVLKFYDANSHRGCLGWRLF